MKERIKQATGVVATTYHGLVLELVLLMALPLFVIRFFPLLIHLRHIVLTIGLIYAYLLFRTNYVGLDKMGFTLQNTKKATRALALPTIFSMVFIYFVARLAPTLMVIPTIINEMPHIPLYLSLFGYVLMSVPLQEIIFRAFYLPRLELVTQNRFFLITYSATLFSLIHLPLGNEILVVGSAILGIFWADNFLKYRNLPAIMLSHALTGAFLWITMYQVF